MYTLIFYINKILILPILYMNNPCFNQSFVKTSYAAILYYNWKDFTLAIRRHIRCCIILYIIVTRLKLKNHMELRNQ